MRQFLTILTLIAILASAKPLSEQSAEEPVAGLPIWLVAAISQPKPIAILVNGEKAEVTPMFALSEAIEYVNEIQSVGANYVIQLSASTYRETKPAVVPTNTTIKGKGRSHTILSFECDCAVAMEISSEGNVRVEDLTLKSLTSTSRNEGLRATNAGADVFLSNLRVETSATDITSALVVGSGNAEATVYVSNSVVRATAGQQAIAIVSAGGVTISDSVADPFDISGSFNPSADLIALSPGDSARVTLVTGSKLGVSGQCYGRTVYAFYTSIELRQTDICGAIELEASNATLNEITHISNGTFQDRIALLGGSLTITNSNLLAGRFSAFSAITNYTITDSTMSYTQGGLSIYWGASEDSKTAVSCQNVIIDGTDDFCSLLAAAVGL